LPPEYFKGKRKMTGAEKKMLKNELSDIFSTYDDDIHYGKLFISLYNEFYNTYSVYKKINVEQFLNSLKEKFAITEDNYLIKEEAAKSKKLDEIDFTQSRYFIKVKEKLLIFASSYKITFFYSKDVDKNEIKKIVQIIELSKKSKKHKKKFYMIARSNHSEFGFELRSFKIREQKVDISSNYNDDFPEVDKTISEFLNRKNANGLVLLHGKYGTGKTSYIRNLMSKLNRMFIFLPLDMIDALSNPSFLPFIAGFKNSILVLEDCETLIKSRENGRTDNGLVNLLNLGDGLLSDALAIKLICTFNADLQDIDRAILRKGRLVARYEFKPLNTKKAKALASSLGVKNNVNKDLTLAEIYNLEKHDYSKVNDNKKIGF